MNAKNPTVRVNLKLSEDVHKQAKSRAALAGKSLQEWIEALVQSATSAK